MKLIFTLIICSLIIRCSVSRSVYQPVPDNEAIKKLSQVFAINDRTGSRRNLQPPPQYMLDLYDSVADQSGIIKSAQPYNSTIVRSYTAKELKKSSCYMFNTSGVGHEEKLLQAELHVYMTKTSGPQTHMVRVYQILDPKLADDPEKNKLIETRFVGGTAKGWHVFRVRATVDQWLSDPQTNYGFAIVAFTLHGKPVKTSRRTDQPVLVLFTDDITDAADPVQDKGQVNSGHYRQRREVVDSQSARKHDTYECNRRELYVDFESIGWSEWIIAPKGYNAYHCSGTCSFPLGQNQKPTNHATVQSIVHEMNLSPGVGRPCCVPSRLLSLSLLYYDDNDNVVLKQYGDMVAESCGCH